MGAVGINASIIGSNPTGLGIYAMRLVQHLDDLRDDLVVYSSVPEMLQCNRARVVRIPPRTRPEYAMRGHLARVFWTQTALRRRLSRDRLTALVNPLPEGVLLAGVPQVTVVHDLLPLRFPAEYPRQKHFFAWFVPLVLRESRIVVADSQSTREDVIRQFRFPASKVRVIPAGGDESVFFPDGAAGPSGSDEPYCLYVGNLLPHKNLLVLLEALALLRRRARCRLVIRGSGRSDYRRLLQAHIEALHLTEAVTFVNYMNGPLLRHLYQRAACLVLPSLGEGFGLPVIEAMACGTPVVVARTTSLPEVAGDAALQVDPHDPAALAAAMHRVLSDHALRVDLRRRGLVRAAVFTSRRTAAQISQAIDEVLIVRELPMH